MNTDPNKKYVLILYVGYLMTGFTLGLSFIASALLGLQLRSLPAWEGTHIVWQLRTVKQLCFSAALLLGGIILLFKIDPVSFSLVGEKEKGEAVRLFLIFLGVGAVFLLFMVRMIRGVYLAVKDKPIS